MIGQTIGSIRRNHALEHATIAVLANRLGRDVRLIGRATRNGYYLYGDMQAEQVEVSPMCGTNLAVAGILAGLSSIVALGNRSRLERIPNVLLASMLAVLVAQPLGRIVQKHLTTDPDLSDTELVSINEGGRGPGRFHRVETVRRPAHV
jgi:hypothetical protein